MAFFDKVKNTITTGIKNTVKGVAEKSFATPKAPSYTQPKKTAYQNITAKPVETKWYKGAVPTASEMEARAIKVGQQDYQRGEYLYGLFQVTLNDPTSPLFNPYTKPTSQAASELSAMGFDVSDPNFIQNNAWLKGEYRLGTSGSPLAPSNSSTAEQNAAYWYNKYMDDDETTLKAEQEWAALQEEVGYWAGRKDRNLTDEEIFSKINWNNYPTLKRMDEAKGKGLSVGLTRPIGYSQDALNGVIYGKRNGVEGDPSRLAVRAAYDGSTGYQRNEEVAARLNPNSDMYNPYAVGSTIDDQALYFGVDSFDKDWVANNRQYMSSMDETERRMYNAVAKAEVNTSAAETEHAALMAYIDEQIAVGETDPDEIIEKVYGDGWGFDMAENGKTLAKMDESLEPGGTPIAMTRAVPYSRNDVERYIQERCEAENQKKGMDAVVGGLQSFVEKLLTPKELTPPEKIAADTKKLAENAVSPTTTEVPETTTEVPETTTEVPEAEDVELGLLAYMKKNPSETNVPAVKVEEVINPTTAIAQIPANPVNPLNQEAMKVTASVVVSHGTEGEKKALTRHVTIDSLKRTNQFVNNYNNKESGALLGAMADAFAGDRYVDIVRAKAMYTGKYTGEYNANYENALTDAEEQQVYLQEQVDYANYAYSPLGGYDTDRLGRYSSLSEEQKEIVRNSAYNAGDVSWYLDDAAAEFERAGIEEAWDIANYIAEISGQYKYEYSVKTQGGEMSFGAEEIGTNTQNEIEKLLEPNPFDGIYPIFLDDSDYLSNAEAELGELNASIAELKASIAENKKLADLDAAYLKDINKEPILEKMYANAEQYGAEFSNGLFSNVKDEIDFAFDVLKYEAPGRNEYQTYEEVRAYYEQSGRENVEEAVKRYGEKFFEDYAFATSAIGQIIADIDSGKIKGITEEEYQGLIDERSRLDREKQSWDYYMLQYNDDFDEVVQRVKNNTEIRINYLSGAYEGDMLLVGSIKGREYYIPGLGFNTPFSYMTEEERDTILYLYETQGSDAAEEYYNMLDDRTHGVIEPRRQISEAKSWEESAKEAPVETTILSIFYSPAKIAGGLYVAGSGIFGYDIDPYEMWLNAGINISAARGEVKGQITNTFGEGTPGAFIGNLFYDAATSAGDSLIMSALTPGVSLGSAEATNYLAKFGLKAVESTISAAPMALGAAGDVAREVLENGGSQEQARMMAGWAFAAETLSESVTVGNIHDAFNAGSQGTKKFLKQVALDCVEEGTGEMMSEFISTWSDDAIMGELSQRNRLKEQFEAQGMSPEEAQEAADRQIMRNIWYAGLTGAMSGGMSTTISYVGGRVGSSNAKKNNVAVKKNGAETKDVPFNERPWAKEQTEAQKDVQTEAKESALPPSEIVVPEEQATTAGDTGAVPGQAITASVGGEFTIVEGGGAKVAVLEATEGDDVNKQAKTEAVAAALVTSEEQMPSAIASAQEMNSEYGDEATRIFMEDVITKAGMNAQTAGAIVAASLSKGESHQMLTSMVTGETEVTPETVNQLVETVEADAQNPEIQGEIMGNIQRSVINNAVIDAGNAGGFNSIASQQTAVQTANQKLEEAKSVLADEKHQYQALGESLGNAVAQFNADPQNQQNEALVTQIAKDMEGQAKMVKQAEQTVSNATQAVRNANKQLELTKATTLDNLRKQETQRIVEEALQIDKNAENIYNNEEVNDNAVQRGSINQGQELDHGQLSAASGRNDGRGNNLYAQSRAGQDEAGRGTEGVAEHNGQDTGRVPARLLSKEANENLTKNGVTNQPLYMESDLERFSNALEEAKSSNDHGAYVDGQSVDSLKEKGAKIIMSEDGLSGAAVGTAGKEKGNIFGVFKSKQSNAKKASAQLMIQAVANGGNKLDCFNGNLSVMYSTVGFIPVARVAFNEEYAPEGWNYERDGKPDVVFWIHNGDDADVVAQKYGKGESEGGYHVYTSEEIAELPLFEDYDEAWDYRDGMMNEESEAGISATGGNGNIFSDQNNDAEPMPRQKERQFASKTLPESDAPGEAVQALLNDPEQLYYTPTTNREQVQKAYARIQEEGYEAAIQRVLNLEKMNANDNADAYTLLAMAKDKGDIPGFIELARKVNVEGTEQGRTLQIRTLLKRMTPTGIQTWAAGRAESDLTDWMAKHVPEMKTVNNRAEKVSEDIKGMDLTSVENQRWGQDVNKRQLALIKTYNLEKVSRPGVNYNRATRKQRMLEAILATPDPLEMTGNGLSLIQRLELIKKGKEVITVADLRYMAYNMEAFMNLEDQDSRQADIYLARTYEAYGNVRPATVGEKARTWRYTSMLLSIPSAARNVIGNALQNFDNAIAHGVATAIDKGVGKITGERTTASISMQDRVDGWKKFVEETKNTFRDYFVDKAVTQKGENRFNTNQRGRVFENSIIESMRLVEGYLMTVGDRNFWKKAYFNSIAEQRRVAELNGVDFDLEQALEQAEQDANFATFNEDGKVRNALQTMKKAVPFLDYIIPFTGTPTNIIRRMIQFSPIGLATNMVKHGVNRYVRKQTFDQHQFVDDMARGLVGTMKFAGGIGLAMLGVIKVGYGDEEDDKVSGVESAQGKPYSFYITINGQNYDLSTFAPSISPLIMGVAAFEIFKNDKNALNAVQSAAIAMGDQIFEASYMSGVRDVFKGFGSPTENIVTTLASNMLGQNIPAFLGQLASSLDPYVRDTKDKDYIMQTLKTGLINKIPVLRSTLLPEKVDVAGRSFANTDQYVALFDPFNRTAAVDDPTLDELMRLNESLGTSDFMPTNFLSGSKNTISGYEGELTDKQKETCKKRYGELWRLGGETLDKDGNKVVITGMEELMNSDAYQKMNDVEKANALTGIMQAAKDGATREAVEAAGLKKKGTAEKTTKKTTRAMPEQFAGRTDGVFGKLADRYEVTGDGAYIPKGIGSSFERSEGKGENKKTYSYNLTPEEHDELYAIYENKLTKKLKGIDWNAPEEVVAQAVENAYSSAATSAKDEWHDKHK